jgi:hypothetical protein
MATEGWTRHLLPLLVAAVLMAAPAGAQQPLSAIDWLSNTVATPPRPARPEPEPAPTGSPVEEITTQVLDGPNLDARGLLPVTITGLPVDFWSASDLGTIEPLIREARIEGLPALRDFFQMLMLAEVPPPQGSDGKGAFLVLRIDRLLDMAALDAAAAMIDLAETMTPDLFRRAFDIALLLGTEDAACETLRANPGIAPTLTARIFCLARGGDWQAAALTFNTAQALGQLSDEDEALIARFLDPDLFEDEPPLPPPTRLSPLTLRLYEAIGEAIPGNTLPLAFAHSELSVATGWRARLDAAERLARMGAITPGQAFAIYTERMPAASGGVWVRVDAVQRFETAMASGDPVAVGAALPRVFDALQDVELEVPFAEHYAQGLMRLPLAPDPARLALQVGLLSPGYEDAARGFAQIPDDLPFLRAIAQGRSVSVPVSDSMARAIAPVFAEPAGRYPLPSALGELVTKGAMAEAVLMALARIADGSASDPRRVAEGLALLRRVGLEDLARRTALQLLILERRG